MVINATVEMTKNKSTDAILIVVNGVRTVVPTTHADYRMVNAAYNVLRSDYAPHRATAFDSLMERDADFKNFIESINGTVTKADGTEEVIPILSAEEILQRGIGNLIKFFKEFEFQPNFRFINTLSYELQSGKDNALEYVRNYFMLTDNSYATEVCDKITSTEFKSILTDLVALAPTHRVNNRFKIYYGSQGTGKTTIAQTETDNLCIVCNNSMIPADLMEDFTFCDGNATFKHSTLWECMENGKPIVLDEINLLPFESLRFLQGILDNKTEFTYKGQTVHIKEGFSIIGTMNLTVNGATFGLPEPLVDRCKVAKRFELTPDMLMFAII